MGHLNPIHLNSKGCLTKNNTVSLITYIISFYFVSTSIIEKDIFVKLPSLFDIIQHLNTVFKYLI